MEAVKRFEFLWPDDLFLLHIQISKTSIDSEAPIIYRSFSNNSFKKESVKIPNKINSHRFIVSKSLPEENKITIFYPDSMVLEAFRIDDRAYYPTESFFKQ